METPTVDVPVSKVVKEKKPRTEAQIAAQKKALAMLKEKRDKAKAEENKLVEEAKVDNGKKKELEKILYEKAKYQRKKLPPAPSYVTMGDLENFKNDLLGSLTKTVVKPIEPEVVKAEPKVVERVIEKIVEKPVPVVQPKLTGHELLDRIFFNK